MDKKKFQYKTDTQILINNMQRDFQLMTEKSEMVTVHELREAKGKHLTELLDATVEKGVTKTDGDFFLLVKRHHEVTDRLMDRIKIKQSLALPTPRPGFSYWWYHADTQGLEFLFDIPTENACKWALKNKYTMSMQKPVAMKTILDYYDGTLTAKVDTINEQIQKGIENE